MRMDRLRRVADLWNWLPAFRVVAEYENIQKAAVVLGISPSALSRTVRLLEEAVGSPLFVRSASGLTLTTAGGELLKGTRDAMRRIDDVVARDLAGDGGPTIAAAAAGPVLSCVLDRAVCALVRDHAHVRLRTTSVDDEDAVGELLRGNVDLVLVDGRLDLEVPAELSSDLMGELRFAILAPPTHAMACREVEARDFVSARMVGIAMAPHHQSLDAHAIVASIESAQHLAERGSLLAHLPAALAPATFRVVGPSDVRVKVRSLVRKPLAGGRDVPLDAMLAAIRRVVGSA